MGLSKHRRAQINRAIGGGLARYIKFVASSSKTICDPADIPAHVKPHQPCILACWHGQFMMLAMLHPHDVEVQAMVARHGDAELIGAALEKFDVELIRGAGAGGRRKDRGGAAALRKAVRALNTDKLVFMTADVPPGPARRCGEGIISIAQLSGRPIVAIAAATSRYHALSTWSRMTINLPFSTLAFAASEPLVVPRNGDAATLEACRKKLEDDLNDATRRAYALAGADPTRATPADVSIHLDDQPTPPGVRLKTYRALTSIVRPAAPLILRARESRGKEEPSRRAERLGKTPTPRPAGNLIWFHAASVGETTAILPVIDLLAEYQPDLTILLTTGTLTSARLAIDRLPQQAIHQFAPLDAPQIVQKFLDHWQPSLAVFAESEIWPNILIDMSKRAIPVVLVNGRISNRSYKRWTRNLDIARPLFSRFNQVLAQNEMLADRFLALGARRVAAVGNLKIDAPPPPINREALSALREAIGTRHAYIAASTHEGEEKLVAQTHRILAGTTDSLVTIIVPRHPERGPAIADDLRADGFAVAQRSLGGLPDARTEIYIADTLGELGTLYAATPLAFIGGSIVDKGGQNPIEAIRHGTLVIAGQHRQNFAETYQALETHQAIKTANTANELASAVTQLLTDEAEAQRMQSAAETAVASLAGALEPTLQTILSYLPPTEDIKRAG